MSDKEVGYITMLTDMIYYLFLFLTVDRMMIE